MCSVMKIYTVMLMFPYMRPVNRYCNSSDRKLFILHKVGTSLVEPDKNKLYEMTGIGCDRSNNVTFYIFNTNNSKK